MPHALGGKLWVKGIIRSQLGVRTDRILFCEHHQSHAAATFLTAPTRSAAILTADGVGEWATLTLGRGEVDEDGSTRIQLSRELRFPHSLGMLYSTFTAYLGFPVNEGEYKVMGLAAYGNPTYEGLLKRIAQRTPDGGVALDLSWFDFHQGARHSYSRKMVAELGPPREPWDPIDLQSADGRRYADVAASVQRVLEEILVDLARRLQRETGLQDLCLGGGVALNGVANARILRESGFRNVYVPSAPASFPASPARTASSRCGCPRRSSSGVSRTSSPGGASWAGCRAPASWDRARWATGASSPRRTHAGRAIVSTAASSTARSSGLSRP